MLERVRQIGGTLEIHSNGNGTSVLVTLPLTEEGEMKAEEILKKERATSQS
jgi:signal transduction histidine kinase